MSFDFINPWMLLGLAGISLPVLAHLLSKKKYDIVSWGAMQFLELGRNTRRKIRLEELLLMLLRMGLIALIAVALARPWASGGMLSNLISTQSRDVVLILDGSYSMEWKGREVTPHAAAVQWAHQFLEVLRPGDTVALLDAREQVRPIIESPVRNLDRVRDELDRWPAPAGSANLAHAVTRAVQILSRTTNLSRDVVVLTDGQAHGWSADDRNLWTRFDDLRTLPSVGPRVWVVNAAPAPVGDRTNFSVDRLQLSRQLTVTDFPIRVQTKVHYSGGETAINRPVYFEVNGQRLTEKTVHVLLQPNGEASIEFEHRFSTIGSHLVSVVLDDDPLPGDNRSDAAVTVTEALPVLLVDGDPHLDATRSETFFARAALSARRNQTPWVRARVVPIDQFQQDRLAELPQYAVVVLANVERLDDRQAEALHDYVADGGGLLIAPGDHSDADDYNNRLGENGLGILPASLIHIERATEIDEAGVQIVNESLELPWMSRFRAEHDGGFTDSRFLQWWRLQPVPPPTKSPESPLAGAAGASANTSPAGPLRNDAEADSPSPLKPTATAPLTAARLTSGDPFLVTHQFGRGQVILLAGPLDADWSTLPAKPDYVSLLHELIFLVSGGRLRANVVAGEPLVFPLDPDQADSDEEYLFRGPDQLEFPALRGGSRERPVLRLDDTRMPGVYRLEPKSEGAPLAAASAIGEGAPYFVVDFDRTESDLTPLSDEQRESLASDERMTFIEDLDDLKQHLLTDDSRSEFWPFLLLVFLAILVGEVFMVRRLVQGGHEQTEGPLNERPDEATDPTGKPHREMNQATPAAPPPLPTRR